jgi:hypothetical protein
MIRVLGHPKRLCDGLTRRDLLRIGTLGTLGLGLAPTVQADPDRPRGFGRAKSCILLYLYGAPSQLETFDPKPDAPREIRGEFGCIPSVLPGVQVGELLPRLAQVLDRTTIVRSMTHPYPIHGVAYALTGIPRIDVPMELNPRDSAHWPFLGSVVAHLDRQKTALPPEVPPNLLLPFPFSSRRVGEVPRAGPYGGFLGPSADPIATEFVGQATRTATKTLADQTWEGLEPYRGITADSRFTLGPWAERETVPTFDALDRRRSLLEQIEAARPTLEASASASATAGVEDQRALAYTLMESRRLREAFDLGREPMPLREDYGLTLFGQAALTARRLVEAGGRFISVFWDEYGLAGTGWDTHWDHFARMKDELTPGFDQAVSALIRDLDARGMLDETLVLCLSEHGRTPKLSQARGGGRDHWSHCYSVLLAGGGIARGRVVGRSDRTAAEPVEHPVSPKDILATAYHLLGIDPRTELIDRLKRPLTLVPEGRVDPLLLA